MILADISLSSELRSTGPPLPQVITQAGLCVQYIDRPGQLWKQIVTSKWPVSLPLFFFFSLFFFPCHIRDDLKRNANLIGELNKQIRINVWAVLMTYLLLQMQPTAVVS